MTTTPPPERRHPTPSTHRNRTRAPRRNRGVEFVAGVVLLSWVTLVTWRALVVARVATARASGERGDVLANLAYTVGLVIIAGAVLLVVRSKSQAVVSHICTNADPTTC